MSNFQKSKTYQNLMKAFSGESEAHTKYQYYSSKAKKEGYNTIASFFDEAAKNEKEHAKLWFKALHNDDIPITKENLIDAIKGEHYETSIMYTEFAKIASEEGYDDIANLFKMVGEIESSHEAKYKKLLDSLENGKIFKSDEPILWICTNCGHVHKGKEPPKLCSVCKHPQGYFKKESEI